MAMSRDLKQPSSSRSSYEDKDKSVRRVGKYEIYETLGKGGYSWVKRGYDTQNETVVALKFQARVTDEWALEQAEQVRTEIKSLTSMRHEHVTKLYAYNLSARYMQKDGTPLKCILFVLEYCPGGELFDILYYTERMTERMARTYFHQMVNGLAACHKTGIVHRDLKPQNLLMDADFKLKISDFGLSKIIESDADFLMRSTYVGTRGYQAPELLLNKKYSNMIDIFSLGVVFFIMLAGYPPFERAHKTDKWYYPLTKGDNKGFWEKHKNCKIPNDVRDLVTGMLAYKPRTRWTIAEIKKHPWWSGRIMKDEDLKAAVLKKYNKAIQKKSKDPRKQGSPMNSVSTGSPKREVSLMDASRDATEELLHFIDEKAEHKTCGCIIMKRPEPAVVTQATRPRGLNVFKTKMRPHIAVMSIADIFRRLGQCNIKYNWLMGDPYSFDAVFELPPVETEKMQFQIEVRACKVFETEEILIVINQIKVSDKLAWVKLFKNIMSEVFQWDVLCSSADDPMTDTPSKEKKKVDPMLARYCARPEETKVQFEEVSEVT